jgi:hypothetical protein
MAYYFIPPEGKPASITPSLVGRSIRHGVGANDSLKMNGATNGSTNGTSNGIANGIKNGMTSGTANGMAHSMIDGIANGIKNSKTNGKTSGTTNGTTNGTANWTKSTPHPYHTEAEPGNPTVIPAAILKQFHFTFLIRHPRRSIPSYYRCTIPPLDNVTGFYNFMPSESGYGELRRIFDFLRSQNQIGPARAGKHDRSLTVGEVSITVIDADDMLDNPHEVIKAFCKEIGLDYSSQILNWDSEAALQEARDAFAEWKLP